jgi:hypothetical protein
VTAKTTAERQAQHKERMLAAGMHLFKRWVHKDDLIAVQKAADALDQTRLGKLSARQGIKGSFASVESSL